MRWFISKLCMVNALVPGRFGNNKWKLIKFTFLYGIVALAFAVNVLLGECPRASLTRSQHWMPSNFDWYNYVTLYGGQIQQYSSCLVILIEIINKCSVPYCGSNDNNSTGVSLSEILFSFMIEKYIVCDACVLTSPSFESSSVFYVTPTYTSSTQELIMHGMQQKWEKSSFWCKKNT